MGLGNNNSICFQRMVRVILVGAKWIRLNIDVFMDPSFRYFGKVIKVCNGSSVLSSIMV